MAGARIQLKRATAAQWSSANPVLYSGEIGFETDTNKLKIGDGSTTWNSLQYTVVPISVSALNDLGDVTITSATNGDFLRWNGSAWINDAVNLSTDTIGSYVESLVAGTGVTLTNNSGEGATPTIAIGQSVATSASVEFAALTVSGQTEIGGHILPDTTETYDLGSSSARFRDIYLSGTSINLGGAEITSDGTTITFPGGLTGDISGNADTASELETARAISLSGDVSGSVSFNGSADVNITATIQPNSVALGADTTGNYVNDITAGTGVTVTHTPGEGSSATIAIGQAVGTTDNPTFAGATIDAVKIGVTAAGEIDTSTGNLTIDSAGGTVTVDDNLTVTGNLTVSGTTTTINTETLTVDDNVIVLNNNATGAPSENAGIEVERGSSTNVAIRWNETSDKWETTNDGTTYGVVAQLGSIALGTDTTGNYMSDVTAGTGISVTHTAGEGSSASISLNASLDNLTDAAIATPLLSQSLVYDGTNWVNQYAPVATYAQNAEATALAVGEVVYLFGAAGDRASVKRASNSAESTSSKTVGVVSVGGSAGSDVTIVTNGYVSGINLSAYTAGDVLWLGSTAGTFTTTKPSAPNHLVFIGVVARANGGNGILYVKCQNGYELDELHDVAITSATSGDFLKWNGTTWVNDPINLGTDTTGDYVQNLTAGTGVTLTNNSGEGSSPTIAIGQSVATNATVTFTAVNANLTGNVTGNADTATTLATSRTIELTGDVTGSASFNGSANATIAATIAANSVALGTDTTGNYVQNLVAGTGITLTNNTGESATPTVAVTANTYEAYGAVSAHEADTTNIHGITDTSALVTMTGTQTLTNKTLTSPTITGVSPQITLAGDLSGSVTLTDLGNGTLTATIAANSVALGTDTTGNYMSDVVAGTGVTVSHTPGEGSSATISIPQSVATSASPTFVAVTLTGTPTATTHAVTKAYVDDIAAGINYHDAVEFATAAVLPNSPSYSNGTNGLGATLTATTNARLVVDGGNVTTGDRILVKDQASGTQNGIYYVTAQGSVSSQYVLTRATDFDGDLDDVVAGDALFVINGSTNVNQGFILTSKGTGTGNAHVFGTDSLSFTQFTGASNITAGTGLSKSGNTISIDNTVTTLTGIQTLTNKTLTSPTITGVSPVVTLAGDLSGSVTLTDLGNGTLTATIAANSVALGTDTTGNYMSDVTAGTGISVTHTAGEGSSATVALNATLDDLSNVSAPSPSDGQFLKYVTASSAWVPAAIPTINNLDDVGDVTITSAASGDFLKWNGSAWVNDPINLGTDTVGNYMSDVTAGTGISVTHTAGEGSTATITNAGVTSVNGSTGAITGVVRTSDTGTVTSTMIADGTIVNGDISTSAAIAHSKLANASAGQVLLGTTTTGVVTATTVSGDVTITGAGVTAIGSGVIVDADVSSTAAIAHSKLANATAGQVLLGTTTTGVVTATTVTGDVTITGAGVTAIGSGVIVNADINASAAIDLSKLASGTSAQVIVANSTGVPTYTTLSGDVTISNTGVVSIAANSVALGTDTTGNYMSDVTAGTGVSVTHTAGEGSTATIAIGQSVATSANPTFAGATLDAIQVGITAANEIDTSTGNLTIDSAGGTVTVDDNLTVTGNLTVSGTTTTVNTATLSVADNLVTLNSDFTTGAPTENAGIEVLRGSSSTVAVRWNETNDKWEITNDGTNYGNIVSTGDTGTVTSTMIADGTIVNADINASAAIALSKLATSTAGNIIVYNSSGVPTSVAETGDVTISDTGVTAIASGVIVDADVNASAAISHSKLANITAGSILMGNASNVPTATAMSGDVTITSGGVTAIASGVIVNADISSTAAIDLGKLADISTSAQTASYTLVLSDKNKIVEISNASANNLTVPLNSTVAFPVGSQINILQTGAGQTTVVATGGVTINATPGLKLRAQWSYATLIKRATDTWVLVGDLSA